MTQAAGSIPQTRSTNPPTANRWWLSIPLTIVIVIYLLVAAKSAAIRVSRPWSMGPWESQIVMDAWRILHGQAAYTDPGIDHATHMYGPLATYVAVPLVKMFGADQRLPRVVSLVSALLLAISTTLALARGRGCLCMLLTFALCMFQFFRVREWATEGRPDAPSLLFSFLALLLFFQSQRQTSMQSALMWMIAATVSTLIGFSFKQTALGVALIPPLVLLINRPRQMGMHAALALIPFAAAGLSILLLRQFWPWVYFHMFTVPGRYPINWGNGLLAALELVRFNSLFVAALFVWAALWLRHGRRDPVDGWFMAAIVVMGLTSCFARAKSGGSYNSMLPAYLAMNLFAARMVPDFLHGAAAWNWPAPYAILLALTIGALPVVDISAAVRTLNPGAIALQHGDRHYEGIITTAAALPGKFVSPDDPVIALRAKGYVGRSAYCELDANLRVMPPFALDELRDADWVLQVARSWPSSVTDEQLAALGFEKTTGMIPESVYTLWKRSTPATRPN